jgi:short subunit dehydrogenase-like uncharacterized protein
MVMSNAASKAVRIVTSGYVLCPCCGYDTIASDDTIPELCSECEEGGCDADGCDPQCDHSEE